MIDRQVRRLLAPPLDAVGAGLSRAGVPPLALTATGWVIGVAACLAAAQRWWAVALVGWSLNRLFDGLDGPVARIKGPTDLGGYLDVVADFSIYGGFVLAVAVAEPSARLACVALLVAYYVSSTALLALSSLLERRCVQGGDSRSIHLFGGLAEGTETVLVYVLFCLLPADARWIAWGFTCAVGVTAVQRVVGGVRLLVARPQPGRAHEPAGTRR